MRGLLKKREDFIGWFILVALAFCLTGCGAGRTMVLAPPETAAKFQAAEIFEDKPTVEVPGEVSSSFQSKLSQELYGEGVFTRGPGLKIRYRFIQFETVAKYIVKSC